MSKCRVWMVIHSSAGRAKFDCAPTKDGRDRSVRTTPAMKARMPKASVATRAAAAAVAALLRSPGCGEERGRRWLRGPARRFVGHGSDRDAKPGRNRRGGDDAPARITVERS